MSEFIYLFRTSPDEQREAIGTPERAQRSMQVWLAWIRELEAHGHTLPEGVAPGATVRVKPLRPRVYRTGEAAAGTNPPS